MALSRGEIWLVNLDPTIGDEIRKVRPAVIMSSDAIGVLALRVVVPITGWQPRFQGCDWLVRLDPDQNNCLDKPSAADAFQVRPLQLAGSCVTWAV
jgi:mRNA interferase MazF